MLVLVLGLGAAAAAAALLVAVVDVIVRTPVVRLLVLAEFIVDMCNCCGFVMFSRRRPGSIRF